MADQWYYSWGKEKLGPFTGQQLQELAESGRIQPTDKVWKAGMDREVSAGKVKDLFAPVPVDSPEEAPVDESASRENPASAPAQVVTPVSEAKQETESSPEASSSPEEKAPEKKASPVSGQPSTPTRKKFAQAVRGAKVVSQDGVNVQYRKICVKCGHEDACKYRLPIKPGVTRATFFCPKCRKLQPVEIQGN